MEKSENGWVRVGSLAEIERQGVVLARGADRPIAVFAQDGHVSAMDNR